MKDGGMSEWDWGMVEEGRQAKRWGWKMDG